MVLSTVLIQGASLIRQPSVLMTETMDNCPLCQPRYSKSPERLQRGQYRPPQQPHFEVNHKMPPRPQLRHKLSYGDLLSSKQAPPVLLQKSKQRRSRSEFRPQLKNNENDINPLNLHPKSIKDHNGNFDYVELQSDKVKKNRSRLARSKSRGGPDNGLLTIWPGKSGIWLPQ